MKILPILALATALSTVGVDGASAGPMPVAPRSAVAITAVEDAALVCGPYRCFRQFGWRYGYGYGFRPFRRFGYGFQRFGYGYRRFGYGRFNGRRW